MSFAVLNGLSSERANSAHCCSRHRLRRSLEDPASRRQMDFGSLKRTSEEEVRTAGKAEPGSGRRVTSKGEILAAAAHLMPSRRQGSKIRMKEDMTVDFVRACVVCSFLSKSFLNIFFFHEALFALVHMAENFVTSLSCSPNLSPRKFERTFPFPCSKSIGGNYVTSTCNM